MDAANLSHSNLWSLSRFGCCGCHFRHLFRDSDEPPFDLPFGVDNDDIAATLAVYRVITSLVAPRAEVDLLDYLNEGREQLRIALENDSRDDVTVRVKALAGAGNLARLQRDFQKAAEVITESLLLSRQQRSTSNIAISFSMLGLMAWNQGELSEALPFLEESLTYYRQINDLRGVAATLNNLGRVTWNSGNSESSYQLFQESLSLRRQLGDRAGEAMSLINLGEVSYERGKFQEALTLYQTSLNIQAEIGDRRGLVESLEGLAQIAIALGLPLDAAKMFGAEERFREESGDPQAPNRVEHHNNLLLQTQNELSEAALFWSAWEEGRARSIEDILRAASTFPSTVS